MQYLITPVVIACENTTFPTSQTLCRNTTYNNFVAGVIRVIFH